MAGHKGASSLVRETTGPRDSCGRQSLDSPAVAQVFVWPNPGMGVSAFIGERRQIALAVIAVCPQVSCQSRAEALTPIFDAM